MKYFLSILLSLGLLSVHAQIPELKLSPNIISSDIRGGSISKDDTVQVSLLFKPAAQKPVRSFYLDFQHQISAINMIDITFPTAGAQGSALQTGAQTSYQNTYYPGYYFNRNANNTTESGQTNSNYASYLYSQTSNKAINRIWVVSSSDLVEGTLCNIRFKVTNVAAGFAYDSIYYNFAQAFSGNYGGTYYDVKMPKPNSAWVDVLATSNALINGSLKLSANLTGGYTPKILVADSATGIIKATVAPSQNGSFTLTSELTPNTAYKATVVIASDSLPATLVKAMTVSDYTAAATEFIKQNLDGTFTNSNIASGIGFLAADINKNKTLDGGDLNALFAQAVGADTVLEAVAGQTLYTLPAFLTSVYDTLTLTGYKALSDIYTVNFRTGDTARSLSINYVVPGDINRSHSSLRTQANNVQTYSKNGLMLSIPSAVNNGFPNTSSNNVATIDVNLNNQTVTSNSVEIPFNVDAKGSKVSALQFEVVYDQTKIKFEELKSDLPNSWYLFANAQDGKVKFGAIDKDFKSSLEGAKVPFKLKFSTLENGLDINTRVKITYNLDASDDKGNQLGINLSSNSIKLTGYNNF